MTSLRPFSALDLFTFNGTNLDVLTENYDIKFYLSYLARWPTMFTVVESPQSNIMGYSKSLLSHIHHPKVKLAIPHLIKPISLSIIV